MYHSPPQLRNMKTHLLEGGYSDLNAKGESPCVGGKGAKPPNPTHPGLYLEVRIARAPIAVLKESI